MVPSERRPFAIEELSRPSLQNLPLQDRPECFVLTTKIITGCIQKAPGTRRRVWAQVLWFLLANRTRLPLQSTATTSASSRSPLPTVRDAKITCPPRVQRAGFPQTAHVTVRSSFAGVLNADKGLHQALRSRGFYFFRCTLSSLSPRLPLAVALVKSRLDSPLASGCLWILNVCPPVQITSSLSLLALMSR